MVKQRAGSDSVATEVIVVGAGIVGICTALALAESGKQVTLIDRDEPAAGASMGNAGVISPWACVPQSMPGLWRHIPGWMLDPLGPVVLRWQHLPALTPWLVRFFAAGRAHRLPGIADAMLALNNPNLALYHQWLQGSGHESLLRDGYYVYISTRHEDLDTSAQGWQLRATRGVTLEQLDKPQLQALEPALGDDYVGAVLVADQGRTVNPGRLAQVLFAKARGLGVQFVREQVMLLKPDEDRRWQVVLQGRTLEASQVALTAGVWSARLLESLGVRVSLEAERGYHMMFANPGCELNNCVTDLHAKVALNSMEHGLRVAGTAEFAGIDAPADYRRAEVFKTLAKRALPDLNLSQATPWMGRRPSTPDSVPYIGDVPGHPGLYVGFGHAHLGLTGAPQTGRMLTGLITGQPPNIPMAPYRLDRFGR